MFNKKKKNETENTAVDSNTDEQMATENIKNTDTELSSDTEDIQTDAAAEAVEEKSPEEKLKEEVASLNDKYLRLFAEFDNYKRRTQKERIELLQTAGKDIIVSLLPVLDDFDRANKATENATDITAIREGIILVHSKLKNILAQKGLKEMESIHTPFDTDNHEAITKIPAASDDMKGKVVDELEKGYTLNDKVIRFAKVVVGS